MKDIEDVILEGMPDIPFQARIELQKQIKPLIVLINRYGYLRRMTLVELLYDYYIGTIKGELKKEDRGIYTKIKNLFKGE